MTDSTLGAIDLTGSFAGKAGIGTIAATVAHVANCCQGYACGNYGGE
jgi:hypothetical protein